MSLCWWQQVRQNESSLAHSVLSINENSLIENQERFFEGTRISRCYAHEILGPAGGWVNAAIFICN